MIVASIFWVYHSACKPYDQRGVSLVDRLEGLGLRVRFFTLTLVQILLMLNASSTLCLVIAIVLILMNGFFVIMIGITFIVATGAFGGDGMKDQANAQTQNMSKSMTSKLGGDDDGNPLKKVLKFVAQKFMNTVGKYIVGFVMKYLMAPLRWIAAEKAIQERQVPHVCFVGVGQPLQLLHH